MSKIYLFQELTSTTKSFIIHDYSETSFLYFWTLGETSSFLFTSLFTNLVSFATCICLVSFLFISMYLSD